MARPIERWPSETRCRNGEVERGGVVGRDRRGVDALGEAVDQDDRHAAAAQPVVALLAGGGVGVQAGDEDDAVDGVLEQHLDVLVLGGAAGGLGAQQRRVPALGEHRLDDLRERGEHGVGQLGDDEADEAGGAGAQLLGSLVAEHVEGGQHGLPRLGRHAVLAVEDPRHRGRADAGLLGQVRQSGAHRRQRRGHRTSSSVSRHRSEVSGSASGTPLKPLPESYRNDLQALWQRG